MDNEVDDKECCGLLNERNERLDEWWGKGYKIFVRKQVLRKPEGEILEEVITGYVVKSPTGETVELNSKGLIFQ